MVYNSNFKYCSQNSGGGLGLTPSFPVIGRDEEDSLIIFILDRMLNVTKISNTQINKRRSKIANLEKCSS